MIRKTLLSIGGIWWRCKRCDQTIQAHCDCCEPYHRCAPDAYVLESWPSDDVRPVAGKDGGK